MTRYTVLHNSMEVGTVGAQNSESALHKAQALRDWSRHDVITLRSNEEGAPKMFTLFDTTNGRVIARHPERRALTALHYIQFANVDAQIIRCGTNRAYAVLDRDCVVSVLQQCGVDAARMPSSLTELLPLLRDKTETAEWLLLPYDAESLVVQARAIDTNEARPLAFHPCADVPLAAKHWHTEPQVNRKRCDSTFWIDYASGARTGQLADEPTQYAPRNSKLETRTSAHNPDEDQTTMATKKTAAKKVVKKAAAKKAAPANKAAPAKKSTAPAAKKANSSPQEERNGIKRPKPGGNTALVWDACDALAAKKGSAPTFQEVNDYVEKKDASIPANTRRGNYSVWRKFNGIEGRVTA